MLSDMMLEPSDSKSSFLQAPCKSFYRGGKNGLLRSLRGAERRANSGLRASLHSDAGNGPALALDARAVALHERRSRAVRQMGPTIGAGRLRASARCAHDYCVHPAALDDVARRLRLRFERAGGHAAPGLAVAEAEQSVSIGCEPRLRFGSQDWRLLRTDSGRPRQPKLQH